MEFKHAISILFTNMGQTLKLLVWQLICMAITFGFGCAILIPLWHVFLQTTDVATYVDALKNVIVQFFNGDITVMNTIRGITYNIFGSMSAISENVGATVGLAFGCVFLYAFYGFSQGLSAYPIADMINNKMASNMSFGFASNFIMNIKKSAKFSLARLSLTLPSDLLYFVVLACFILGVFNKIGIVAFTIMLFISILYVATRTLILSGWLPRLLFYPDEGIYTNLARSMTTVKYNASCYFKAFIITFSIVYILTATLFIPSFGLVGLFIPPMYFFLIRAVELVGYYKMNSMSFYEDGITVVDTVEYGYRKNNQGEK